MKVFIAVMVMPLLLAGCALEGKHSDSLKVMNLDDCEDGGTWVNVHYGDSELKVKPKIDVKKGSGIEFRLKPRKQKSDRVDYENATVTVKGKASEDGKNDWIDVQGTASKDGALAVCANVDTGGYEYLVHVEGVGTLDPRVHVDPR
jgi:hypothetical protein